MAETIATVTLRREDFVLLPPGWRITYDPEAGKEADRLIDLADDEGFDFQPGRDD